MCEQSVPEEKVGRRVAVQRKLAGLTQHQFAARAHVSKSLVAQVEIGALPASAGFTAAAAHVLGLDVATLTGEPHGAPITDPYAEHAGIAALRIALDDQEVPDFAGYPMPATELRTRLDHCEARREKGRYTAVLKMLPELLNHAYAIVAHTRPGHDTEQAWAMLDDAYELAQVVSLRFGYCDLAALAAGYGRAAAARAGDPLRAALATYRYTVVRLRRGNPEGVLQAVDRGHALLDGERCPTAGAVRTVLHLRQARAHARLGARDRADEHINEARRLVTGGVPAHPYYSVHATTANVDIHYVRTAVELCDGSTAVGRAAQVHLPADTQPSRAGHHWIDLARAWTLHGDRARAVGALYEARRMNPQKTRYHPGVHETVHLLAEHHRRANDSLAAFARWARITV
ncbi:MAG: helix-turn-helix domain-containing protein [Pseudonocardiaceae bacterium]